MFPSSSRSVVLERDDFLYIYCGVRICINTWQSGSQSIGSTGWTCSNGHSDKSVQVSSFCNLANFISISIKRVDVNANLNNVSTLLLTKFTNLFFFFLFYANSTQIEKHIHLIQFYRHLYSIKFKSFKPSRGKNHEDVVVPMYIDFAPLYRKEYPKEHG